MAGFTQRLRMEITVESHTEEVLEEVKRQIELGLASVGESMEGHAKDGCPEDTGRLRDSIVYVTKDSHGSPGSRAQGNDGVPKGSAEEYEVQVGTNVEYAIYQEFGEHYAHHTGGAHFLRNAASNHSSEYKAIIEAALKA